MKNSGAIRFVGFVAFALMLNFCAPKIDDKQPEKIKFDLSMLNDDGLIGDEASYRAIDYEFCIPASESLKNIIAGIDTTARFFPQSKGRIGCGKGEVLCIGNTRQKNAKETLLKLAELNFVKKIEQTFYE